MPEIKPALPDNSSTETPIEAKPNKPQSLFTNKPLLIGIIVVFVMIAGVSAGYVLREQGGDSRTAEEADKGKQAENKTSSDQSSNQNRGAVLPDNICPDNIFEENGKTRGDYKGSPYEISETSATWIQANCAGKTAGMKDSQSGSSASATENEPPLLVKSIGFNLGTYNAATGKAGDIAFTKTKLPFDQIASPFGQQDPRTTDTTKKNVQPTFILPLGTKVQSIVDGEVVEVKEIYSGDYTIWVAKSTNSSWIYETEHVIKPIVKKGDKVTAGQEIAEVSNYDSKNYPGFGLVEIGILHTVSSGEPEHVCPFKYLEPSIKEDINSKLSALYAAWETYLGKNVYEQEKFVSPGCVIEEPVKG